MKYTLALSIILALNGCVKEERQPCIPQPCTKQKCIFPTLPSYRVPISRKIERPIEHSDGTCTLKVKDLLELSNNNKKLREICWKYDQVNKRVNGRYNK